MTRTLSLSEVKMKLSSLVDDITRRDDEIIITRNGKPAAVLLSADEYESWTETHTVLSDKDLMRQIRQSMKEYKEKRFNSFKSVDELFRSLEG